MMSRDELSPSAAARRLGTSTRSVQRWISTGRLPARRVGGRWRVASDVIDAFVAATGPAASAPARPIGTLFIANRGEIAARISRTADRLGIHVVVPETEGAASLDLLDGPAVVAAAVAAQADALHPGFGFLAESADFAEQVERAGIRWVGPPPAAIRTMGDKAAARRLAASLGIPVVPGYDAAAQSDETLIAAARRLGMPLLVKPAAGGGGKGMRIVRDPSELVAAVAAARREAAASFGDDRLILERYLEGPRHVEVQILFDAVGNGVHLGERDCSIQRRHQKILEESPSPAVSEATRTALTNAALALARAVGYVNAGTCEFLVRDGEGFVFLEMNTRLQVEHPVTEMVTGRDLVADQLRVAAGEPLGFVQGDVRSVGHAIEVRLYAEDPDAGFLPASGRVEALRWPTGEGVRVDAGIAVGSDVTGRFDPMLAKIVAHGADRGAALERLARALDETMVLGLPTNLRFLRWLVRQADVLSGDARIDTLERIWPPSDTVGVDPAADDHIGAVDRRRGIPDVAWSTAATALADQAAWRANAPPVIRLTTGDLERRVELPTIPATAGGFVVRVADIAHVDVDGMSVAFSVAPPPDVDRAARLAAAHTGAGPIDVSAPMPGTVRTVHVERGGQVDAGDPLVTLEAMKMEHVLAAPIAGRVVELHVTTGTTVSRGMIVAVIEP